MPNAGSPPPPPPFAELYCRSCFSFLTGASHPDELLTQAASLGYTALAITDECSVAGVVRALAQASQYVAENPNESARIFAKYTPKFEVDDLQKLLAELTYKHQAQTEVPRE